MIIIACFNSRTRVGATILCPRLSSPNRCFNSRTRVGATGFQGFLHILVPVSIHAPVWVRRSSVVISDVVNGFQFTHPCGCDAYVRAAGVRVVGFNSRTRVGATGARGRFRRKAAVSIHAPVWVRRPDEYGLSIKHATKVLRQPDARTRCGQA